MMQDQRNNNLQSPLRPVKDKICTRFSETGACKYGQVCFFAHGEAELGASNESIPSRNRRQEGGSSWGGPQVGIASRDRRQSGGPRTGTRANHQVDTTINDMQNMMRMNLKMMQSMMDTMGGGGMGNG